MATYQKLQTFDAGHICGDDVNIIDDPPTGSISMFFGYMSTKEDEDKLIWFVKDYVQEDDDNKASKDFRDSDIRVTGLLVYPVKSCGGVSVQYWPISEGGLMYDRQWMVMKGQRVMTQKNTNIERDIMTLSFPGETDVDVSIEAASELKQRSY